MSESSGLKGIEFEELDRKDKAGLALQTWAAVQYEGTLASKQYMYCNSNSGAPRKDTLSLHT